jgi:BirA family biotin operon repressor/biotin-[acetyl-CoA-carboxylase] ligase
MDMSKTDPNTAPDNPGDQQHPAQHPCRTELHPAHPDPMRTERAAGGETRLPKTTRETMRTIDRDRLESQLGEAARTWAIEIVDQTTSTNADLLQALRAERADRTQERAAGQTPQGRPRHPGQTRVKLAYEQTAGRGRRGRSWVAQPGDALLFSVGVQVPRGVDGLVGLSLAVGLAVYDALREVLRDVLHEEAHKRSHEGSHEQPVDRPRLALKWPNDVLVDGAKVSGILIETAGGDAQTTAVVVGIGINLRGAATLAAQLKLANASPATALPSAPPRPIVPIVPIPPTQPTALDAVWDEPSMTDLLAALLNTLAQTFERFGAQGFAPFREAWCEADAYRDMAVTLYEGGTVTEHGIGRGVDAQGQLLLETAQGLRTIASGDVSLRPA